MLPEHLRAAPTEPRVWLQRRAAAIAALALGTLTFIIVAVSQHPMFSTPDVRISVPGLAATLIAAIFSLARRERAYPYWLAGVGLAACALVLGWVMMIAIVVGATAVVIAIIHAVM